MGGSMIVVQDIQLHEIVGFFQNKAGDFLNCIATVTTAKNEDHYRGKVGFIAARIRISSPSCFIHSNSDW